MALLHDTDTGSDLPLPARALVGRASTAVVRLRDRRVSGEHATFLWMGDGWSLRDLGSRNGTYVDGRRLDAGASFPLRRGQRVGFGSSEGRFILADDTAPGPVARELEGDGLRTVRDGLLCLPNDEDPEVVVFDDGRGHWVLEAGDERRILHDDDVVQAGGRAWQILVADDVEGTATVDLGPSVETISLHFRVSRNEEHIEAWFVYQGQSRRLGPREHLYVLLLLARQRLQDRDQPLAEQGWIERDQLLRWLRLEPNRLNVAIHRARGQLAAEGVAGAAAIVEVRRGQRRLGIDPDRLSIT